MPGGFPLGLEICNSTIMGPAGGVAATGGGANTLGAWSEVTASCPIDCCALALSVSGFNTGNGPGCAYDIGVGSAGNEKVIVGQIVTCAFSANGSIQDYILLPVGIPSGTRISVRCQVSDSTANDGCSVTPYGFDGAFTNFEGYSGVDSLGFLSASTHGTSVDPGAVAQTLGSWAQLIASTSRDYVGLFVIADTLNTTSNASVVSGLAYEIGIGGSGSEMPILHVDTVRFFSVANWIAIVPANSGLHPIAIPAGTRISARCQSSNTNVSTRSIGITAYGVYQ